MLFSQTSRFKKKFSTWNNVSGNLEWKKKEEGEEENKKKQEARDMRSQLPAMVVYKDGILKTNQNDTAYNCRELILFPFCFCLGRRRHRAEPWGFPVSDKRERLGG